MRKRQTRQREVQVTVSKSNFKQRNKKLWGLIYFWPNYPKLDWECKFVTWFLVLFCPSCILWTYSILSWLVSFCLLCLFACLCFILFIRALAKHEMERPTKLDMHVDFQEFKRWWWSKARLSQDSHSCWRQTFYIQKHFTNWRIRTIPKRFW